MLNFPGSLVMALSCFSAPDVVREPEEMLYGDTPYNIRQDRTGASLFTGALSVPLLLRLRGGVVSCRRREQDLLHGRRCLLMHARRDRVMRGRRDMGWGTRGELDARGAKLLFPHLGMPPRLKQ